MNSYRTEWILIPVADDRDISYMKRGGGEGTCMRGLETALLTRHQCRVSDFEMGVMANGPLVFIFTHLITFRFYYFLIYHVWLQHTCTLLYFKMPSDFPTFSVVLSIVLSSVFSIIQWLDKKLPNIDPFPPKNYNVLSVIVFFYSPDWSDNLFQPTLT